MAYNDGIIGVDLDAVLAGTGTSSDEGNDFVVGQRACAADGQIYVYVHSAGTIAQYDWVGIDENFEAAALTKAMVDDGYEIGIAQVAIADNEFGWVACKGSNLQGNVLASCDKDVALYTSGTAGKLDDTSTSQTKVDGVVCVASNGATSAANVEVLLTWPKSTTF